MRNCLCRLALNVDTDDVIHKLRDDATLAWMKQLNPLTCEDLWFGSTPHARSCYDMMRLWIAQEIMSFAVDLDTQSCSTGGIWI